MMLAEIKPRQRFESPGESDVVEPGANGNDLDVADFDFPLFLGQTMAFFDECRNSAMAIYDNSDNSEAIRLGALKTAMGAETDKVNLLARVGLFENQPTVFVPDSETSEETDGEQFQKFMKVVAEGYEQKNNAGKNFH